MGVSMGLHCFLRGDRPQVAQYFFRMNCHNHRVSVLLKCLIHSGKSIVQIFEPLPRFLTGLNHLRASVIAIPRVGRDRWRSRGRSSWWIRIRACSILSLWLSSEPVSNGAGLNSFELNSRRKSNHGLSLLAFVRWPCNEHSHAIDFTHLERPS